MYSHVGNLVEREICDVTGMTNHFPSRQKMKARRDRGERTIKSSLYCKNMKIGCKLQDTPEDNWLLNCNVQIIFRELP